MLLPAPRSAILQQQVHRSRVSQVALSLLRFGLAPHVTSGLDVHVVRDRLGDVLLLGLDLLVGFGVLIG